MPVTTRYIVKHRFTYGERVYNPGEEFEPTGARNDPAIIRSYTRMEQVVEPPEDEIKPKARRNKEVIHA